MALTPGTRIGPYEIVSPLGAGGMGEVYRARDAKLNRDVALKILPDAFASDSDRLARFTREAQTLASLNHPNIAHIHGLEESGVVRALVMELVEGEDLAQLISRLRAPGASARQAGMPLDEALPIAKQIAEALEAAHGQGIVHRDLKPANIKVRPDGTVKVLDFGLAKAMEPAGLSPNVSQSPTITTPAMTQAGMILGTAAYMSPEQARGKTLDKRTDIWAFGCVLYEMLTGARAFSGDDVADVLASVMAREPDWTRLPSNLSPALGTYIRRCLEKNPKQRIADAQDVRLALEGAFDSTGLPSAPPVATRTTSAWIVGALIVGAVMAGAVVWVVTRPAAPLAPHVWRLQIVPSGAAVSSVSGRGQRDLAITPDGLHVVYVGNRGTQLMVRAMDSLDAVVVYTGLPRGPFVSPDGQWLAFADSGVLKKVPVSGGLAVPITPAPFDAPTALGATWGPDDTIVFATTNGATGLQRVAAAGGIPAILTRPDVEHGEADHAWPEWLPGGKAVLFTITARSGGLDAAQVAVLDVATGKRKVLFRGGSHAFYLPGYLVFSTPGTLRAVRFDLDRLETRGTPVAVVHDVVTTPNGDVNAVLSADGTLVYALGTAAMTPEGGLLTWVDRRGVETPLRAPPRLYVHPRLSPDGKRLAVFSSDQDLDIWLSDLGPALTRLTSGPGVDAFPVWTRDGHRVIFSSQSTSAGNMFSQSADGGGPAERLTESPNLQAPTGITPDGRTLIFNETFPKTGTDIMQLALDETHRVSALVQSEFTERNGIISPDGQWLAYESNENSSRFEIFVRSFPDVNRFRSQVSVAGGTRPLWARSGRELIYVSSGALMAVGVAPGPTWAATRPALVVKEGYMVDPGNPGRTYDISPDGQRFLMIKGDSNGATATPAGLIVIEHWVEELKRLVPMK